jgi:hypothetical protein
MNDGGGMIDAALGFGIFFFFLLAIWVIYSLGSLISRRRVANE